MKHLRLLALLLPLGLLGCPSDGGTDRCADDDDDDDSSDVTGDDDDSQSGNNPPGFVAVGIDPEDGATPDDPFTCILYDRAPDPDGDRVTYAFEWYVGDVLRDDVPGTQVPPGVAQDGEVWTCRVTPFDGELDGPVGEASIPIGSGEDEPPSQPLIEIQPAEPGPDDALACVIVEASVDPEGATVVYQFQWNQNGSPAIDNQSEVDPSVTSPGEVWECVVTPDDGYQYGPPGVAEVTITAGD